MRCYSAVYRIFRISHDQQHWAHQYGTTFELYARPNGLAVLGDSKRPTARVDVDTGNKFREKPDNITQWYISRGRDRLARLYGPFGLSCSQHTKNIGENEEKSVADTVAAIHFYGK